MANVYVPAGTVIVWPGDPFAFLMHSRSVPGTPVSAVVVTFHPGHMSYVTVSRAAVAADPS
jgi:hypothetical protein